MRVPALLDSATAGYSTLGSDIVGRVMEQEFYQGLAQRVRAMAIRPTRSLVVVCWISPSGTTPRAASCDRVSGPGEA
jgi:hypothetical protein